MKFSAITLISGALMSLSGLSMGVFACPIKHDSSIVHGKTFDRVVIIVLENTDFETAAADSYYASLAEKHNGVLLTNYLAITHPSQPNYIAMITGSVEGVYRDTMANLDRRSLVDLMEAKGISWKSYQQAYPGSCNLDMRISTYARKHNPFMSMVNVQKDPKLCAKIVNADQLDIDIANNDVPQLVFYTPDMNNDAHDTSMSYAGNWLKSFIEPRINQTAFNKNTMFVTTFDENHTKEIPNRVMTFLFGPDFKRSSTGSSDDTAYNHYSLLRTIEDNWELGNLGQNDATAVPFDI
ncbi:secreted acid phosphatase [Phycomyces blakesleeanus]|uniref:Secreted acid phosphatase n=2 Tax=Phycomyces blakesleeanus TaxID=4837 RepID=A0A162V4K7_PHYB8|nr:secreted acid phosphatase [Phycomyces blakesleeanus NRRL 1555(-)]OAD79902.1 secreted acid phosphatase [Phycomyces blakesleeanus NRRL 1555(-)]|eukprot:XP_018297942.1 secreted acid phosphatase [Phycomyces blakesleeanus NRRL 1555(-)]